MNAMTLTSNRPEQAPSNGLGGWRPWLALLVHAAGLSMMIGLSLLLLVAAMAGAAHAQGQAPGHGSSGGVARPASPVAAPGVDAAGASRHGPTRATQRVSESQGNGQNRQSTADGAALVFQTEQGPLVAPLQSSRVNIRIAGNAVRARIVQRFRNPGAQWLNAIYQFPLPDDAAVDALTLRIGERLVVGEIREKARARRDFQAASSAGKRAALVSQQRPNVFTADVANIAPGAEVEIAIEYQQALGLSDDGWTLRLPTVVAPRYEGGENLLAQTPTLIDGDTRANRLSLSISLNPGLPIQTPSSPSHAVDISRRALPSSGGADMAHAWDIALTDDALANRDFILNWRPAPGSEPTAAMQLEPNGAHWYGLLSVAPPTRASADETARREVIFVIDNSGSMHGTSITQARAALRFGLERLHPQDRFNVIRFNDKHEALFTASRMASEKNLRTARRFIGGLDAEGGTEMSGALERALLPPIPAGLLSQVVFITDGAVADEARLFNIVDELLGQRRLYTVGIGSSPNSHFMRQAARTGRGSFTMIDTEHAVESSMARLFRRLSEPVLTNLRLRDARGELIATGEPLRDLHAGDPILIALRLDTRPDSVQLEGEHNGIPWQREITLTESADTGIHKLWARAELDRLGAQRRRANDDTTRREALRADALQVALAHGLVSAQTSLIAVDHTPVRPAGEDNPTAAVPRHLPAGWNAARVFGASHATMPLAATATGAWSEVLTGLALFLLAAAFLAGFLYRVHDLFDNTEDTRWEHSA